MGGPRLGDFSRLEFGLRRADQGVYLQQGRVQLDADWNAQTALTDRRLKTLTQDLIGPAGGPRDHAGYGVRPLFGLRCEPHGSAIRLPLDEALAPTLAGDFAIVLEFEPDPGASGPLLELRFEGDGHPCASLTLDTDGGLRTLGAWPNLRARDLARPGQINRAVIAADARAFWLDLNGMRVRAPRPLDTGLPELWRLAPAAHADTTRAPARFSGWLYAISLFDDPFAPQSQLSPPKALWRFDDIVPERPRRGRRVVTGPCLEANDQPAVGAFRDLVIEAGRYYVAGAACELGQPQLYTAQAGFPARDQSISALGHGDHLLYLEVREQTVTPDQDPSLAEPALGGGDTAVRVRAHAHVAALNVPSPIDGRQHHDSAHRAWSRFVAHHRRRGLARFRRRTHASGALADALYRVEIQTSGWAWGSWDGVVETAFEPQTGCLTFHPEPWAHEASNWRVGDLVRLDAAQGALERTGRILALSPAHRQVAIEVDGDLDADRLTVQRVATFKWSRNNGAATAPCALAGGDGLQFTPQGLERLDPRVGDWLEVLPAETLSLGAAGTLARIATIDFDTSRIGITAPLDAGLGDHARGDGGRLIARRWDHGGASERLWDGALRLTADGWTELERGVEVGFEADEPYRTGDFWCAPTRQATGLDWPNAHGAPRAEPPLNPIPALARLAHARIGDDVVIVHDERRLFDPLAGGDDAGREEVVDGSLKVLGEVNTRALIAQHLVGRLESRHAVSERALADHAVSIRTLARDVGVLPMGAAILTGSAHPPPGFIARGHLHLPHGALQWLARPELPRLADGGLETVVVGDEILLVSGEGALLRYWPATGDWIEGPHLPVRARHFALTAADGALFLLGGVVDGRLTSETWRFDPPLGQWRSGPPMSRALSRAAAAGDEDGIWVCGGQHNVLGVPWASDHVERLDLAQGVWTAQPSLPRARLDHAAVWLGDGLYVLGGKGSVLGDLDGIAPEPDRFDGRLGTWSEAPPADLPARKPSVTLADDQLLVAPADLRAELRRFDPASGQWGAGPETPEDIGEVFTFAAHQDQLYAFAHGEDRRMRVFARPLHERAYLHAWSGWARFEDTGETQA